MPTHFPEHMRFTGSYGKNKTRDEARRELSPPRSFIPCTQPFAIQNLSVPCAVNRELTLRDLIVPPRPWNMTPAPSLGAAFSRPRVEQQLSRGHFVPCPPCVSGKLDGGLGLSHTHTQQSQLRYQASVVSITTPKHWVIMGNRQCHSASQGFSRALRRALRGPRCPSLTILGSLAAV